MDERNILTIKSTLGTSKVELVEVCETLIDSIDLMIRFFRGEGFQDETILEALKETVLEMEVNNV